MNDISKTNIWLKNLLLILKGVAMGAANKVPGVSGGIIALIGGFYEELINSFQHFNSYSLKLVLKGDFKKFWAYVNGSFLSYLFFGVILSYFSVSLILDYLLENYELFVIGGFFGMILSSVLVIIKQVKLWNLSTFLIFFIGLSFGLIIIEHCSWYSAFQTSKLLIDSHPFLTLFKLIIAPCGSTISFETFAIPPLP